MAVTWLLIAAGVWAVIAGVRRSRWDGMPARVLWRNERLYRRPGQIVRRLLRVFLAVVLITASIVALMTVVGLAVASVAVLAVGVLAWYGLRLAAGRVEPEVYPVERLDVDLDAWDVPDVDRPLPDDECGLPSVAVLDSAQPQKGMNGGAPLC